jgi:hypothetical protein
MSAEPEIAKRGQEIAENHWESEKRVRELKRRVDDAWSATDASERAGESASTAISFIGNETLRVENLWTSCKRSSRVFKHLLRLENPAVKENGNIVWEGTVAGLSAVQGDIEWISNKSLKDSDQIFREDFWRHDLCSEILLPRWEFFKSSSVGSNGAWNFWIDWLESFFNGAPLDPELQRRIALGVSDEIWDAGTEAVASEIAKTIEPYKIQQQILALKAELAAFVDDKPGIGHNNPPIDKIMEAPPQEIGTIVWGTITEIEHEIENPKPDKNALERLAKTLKQLGDRAGHFLKDVAYDNAKSVVTGLVSGTIVVNCKQSNHGFILSTT